MNRFIKNFLILILAFASYNCAAHFDSRAYKPIPLQMYWRADVNVPEARFRVSAEPRYLDAEKKEFTYDLRVYQIKDDSEVLAYSEDDIGYLILSMMDTGQWISPFFIVSNDGSGLKTFRGLDFHKGKVKLGAKVKSARTPEITVYPSKVGVVVLYSLLNERNQLKAQYVSYTGGGRWSDSSKFKMRGQWPWDSRFTGLGCDPL